MIRILIADPDPAARKALISLIQRKVDSIIFEAGNVEAFILQVVDLKPDLIVLDWRLHGSPAPELCKLIHKAYPHVKIILLSVDANDAVAARDAGAIFVHKGASPDELIAILKPLVSQKTVESEVKKHQREQ
jgi:two-component system nitrate/nitrite response regulator NarL